MAQVGISNAVLFFFFVLAFVAAAASVSAQEMSPSPAPVPMDAGAAYSLPVSGAVVGASIVISLFSLFKN